MAPADLGLLRRQGDCPVSRRSARACDWIAPWSGPGSVIEWELEGDKLVVRRANKYSMQDLHSALFPKGAPARKTDEELREGVRKHLRKKHAGD